MEVMTDQHTTLFIDWKVKPKDIGKKGAMGTVTHGSCLLYTSQHSRRQAKLTTRSMLTRSSEQQTTDIPFPVPAVLSA